VHYTYNFSKSQPQAESFENFSLDFLIECTTEKSKVDKVGRDGILTFLSFLSDPGTICELDMVSAQAWFQG